MKFNIATISHPLSFERQGVLMPKLEDLGINYQFYAGNLTELHYDGLYETAKEVIKTHREEEYVIFAEDDLILTDHFSIAKLNEMIVNANKMEMDILVTGCSESYGEKKTEVNGLLGISGFRGTQLIVIFKSAYDCLLRAPVYNHFEDTISKIQPKLKIGLTLPFFSKQREDCVSLITKVNHNHRFTTNERMMMRRLFKTF